MQPIGQKPPMPQAISATEKIPNDVKLMVLKCLGGKETAKIAGLSKSWEKMSSNKSIWAHFAKQLQITGDPKKEVTKHYQRISKKIELISKANALAADDVTNHGFTPPNLKHIQAASKYFSETLAKLKQDIDVPLPRWFHATGGGYNDSETAKTIIKNGIIQRQAPSGYGAYISSYDMSHSNPYCTFTIDERELEGTEGYFYQGPVLYQSKSARAHYTLYVRVLKNIPITSETVAFMVTYAQRADEIRSQVLTPTNLNVQIMTREEATTINRYLETADAIRAKPSNLWEPNKAGQAIDTQKFPLNMQHSGWATNPSTNS